MSTTVSEIEEAPPPERAPGRRVRLLGSLTGGVAVIVVAALALWFARSSGGDESATAAKIPVAWGRLAVSAADLPQRSGVTITQVAVTGAGGLVDLRFKVLDPDKAHAIHDPRTPPAVVDERTGLVINQLLMNHSHSGEFKPAVTYYLIFENTGNWVRRGSKVTVLLGNAQVEHVVVA